jgi:hypothetical protein
MVHAAREASWMSISMMVRTAPTMHKIVEGEGIRYEGGVHLAIGKNSSKGQK